MRIRKVLKTFILFTFTSTHSYILPHLKLAFKFWQNKLFNFLLCQRSLDHFIKSYISSLLYNSLIDISRTCHHQRFYSEHSFEMLFEFVKLFQMGNHIMQTFFWTTHTFTWCFVGRKVFWAFFYFFIELNFVKNVLQFFDLFFLF